MSRAARMPGQGLSAEASSSGSVCMFSGLSPGREGARLGHIAGDRVAPDVPESRLSVIAASLLNVASLGSLCGRNSHSADLACTLAQVGGAVSAVLGSPGGTCAAMVGAVVATLTAVAPASLLSVPLAAYPAVCGSALGVPAGVVGLWWGCGYWMGAPTALISPLPCMRPPMVRAALVWCRLSLHVRKRWKSRLQWLLPHRCVS